MNRPSPSRRHPCGFTLVELLIVIGIIAVLISILVPVINSARKSAYAADSRNQIKNIANAIDRYYQDFSAYPGLFSNSMITAGTTVAVKAGSSATPGAAVGNDKLTSSENMFISLVGGLDATGTIFYLDDMGKGPLSYNPVQPKRYPAYIEATAATCSMAHSSLDIGAQFGNPSGSVTEVGSNGMVPEFIDKFPGAMPIIYLRAKAGAPGNVDIVDAGTDTTQYDYNHMLPYFDPTKPSAPAAKPNGVNTTDFPDKKDTASNLIFSAGIRSYLGNMGLSTTTLKYPNGKDTYLLISPGPDRLYGTADDICNFSFQ